MEIKNILERKLNSLCRTCLRHLEDNNKCDVFLSPIGKWLTVCTSLEIAENDNYPKNLCKNCYRKIENFYEFRKMCLKSVQKFDEIRFQCMQQLQIDQQQQNQKSTLVQYDHQDNEPQKNDMNNMNVVSSFDAEIKKEVEEKKTEQLIKNENEEIKFLKLEEQDETSDNDYHTEINEEDEFVRSNDDNNEDDSDYVLEEEEEEEEDTDKDEDIKEFEEDIETTNETENNTSKEKEVKTKNKKSKKHGQEKLVQRIFTCDVCNKRFLKEEKFEAHKRTHLGLKPWNCSQCDKQYIKRTSLISHIRFHHNKSNDVEIFVCPVEGCGKSYRFKQTLRAHTKSVHEVENGVKQKQSFVCEDCGTSTTTLGGLRRHRLLHASELPFKCEICMKRYNTKYKLNEHIKRHKGIKNFVCSICGLKKISQHELNVHMNYHTRKKLYNCSFCEYSSGNVGNVSRHEKIVHHGIKAYTCKYCGNGFGKAETLKHHEMRHTGEKPHECPECGKKFIQLTAMKSHLKRHEKNRVRNYKKIENQPIA